MDCTQVKDRLVDILYGEGSDEERKALTAHARACETCGPQLSSLRSTREMFAKLEDRSVPAGLSAQILRAATDERPRPLAQRLRGWLGLLSAHPAWSMGAIVLMVGFGSVVIFGTVFPTLQSESVMEAAKSPVASSPAPAQEVSGRIKLEPESFEQDALLGREKQDTAMSERPRGVGDVGGGEKKPGRPTGPFAQPPANYRVGRDDLPDELQGAARPAPKKSSAQPERKMRSPPPVGAPRMRSLAAEPKSSASESGSAPSTERSEADSPADLGWMVTEEGATRADDDARQENEVVAKKRSLTVSEVHALGDQLRFQNRCAEAITRYRQVLGRREGYDQWSQAATSAALCMRRLNRCEEITTLYADIPSKSIANERDSCFAARNKSKK